MLGFLNITLNNSVSALSYQTYQRLDFTFNPTIQLTLSSSELTIPNLTPGSSSDSNIIDISVATNAFGGLNLTSAVGNSSNDTTSLVYRNGNTTIGSFDTLSTTASTLGDIDNNKYGYSYSVKGNNDTWSNYSSYAGLPKYDDTVSTPATLLSTTGTATSGAVKFKLGAKASTTQPSGTYINVINFTAITKVVPTSYTINFNNGTNATNWPNNISDSTSSDINIRLGSGQNQTTAPTKAGYIFKGWCTAETNNANCTGNVYQANETYPISSTGEAVTINLYAIWQPMLLYDAVASLVKLDQSNNPRTQSPLDLQTNITTPTSANHTEDTSNSGVYKYDPNTYGVSSDASNDYSIYYYRGILEPAADNGDYGSNGKATTYPNYIRLNNNTCWRIVRTTGSGGVKMIYNGTWTGSTCANKGTATQATTSPFNSTSAAIGGKSYTGLQYQNMHAGGYTYSNVPVYTTAATSLSTLLGAYGSDTTTNVNSSIIKQYIETWYTSNMMGANNYTSRLEKSAGYCNDRTVYNNGSYGVNSKLAETITVIPYGTSSMTIYRFGAFARNWSTMQSITLGCPRGKVDLYSTTTNTGNGQLVYPVALLTADEAAFAGSGRSDGGTTYSAKSYLRSGNDFWLLSLSYRHSYGNVGGYRLDSNGTLNDGDVRGSFGIRPTVSLNHEVAIISGSGTATDPWIVSPPEN